MAAPLRLNAPAHPAGFWVEEGTSHVAHHNTDTILFGAENKGKIEKNSGLRVNSNESTVEIGANSNCSVIIRNCEAKINTNSKGSVDFTDAKITVVANSHFMIYGHGRPKSYVKFQGNVDFTFEGSKVGDSFFGQNSNVVVVMRKGGGITAKGNTNIKIGGEVQNLHVENVRDHQINSVTGNEHLFSISALFVPSSESKEAKPRVKLQTELSYVGSARVEGSTYTLGDLSWTLQHLKEEQEVKLLFSQLGDKELKVEQLTHASLRISTQSSSSGGSSSPKTLKILGPHAVTWGKDSEGQGPTVTLALKSSRSSEEKEEKPPLVRRLSRRLSSMGLGIATVTHN